jgi:glycosyltransferase involved in cell wall biosynthesis
MSKIPVSVAIVTKNEAQNIKDALESVKDFDDIVVIDAFSSDNTTEICREYTKRVYEHEWQGYAGQKQTAIDHAKNDWVLILDADERVTRELKQEIMDKVKENSLSGFYIPRKNFFLGKWIRHSGWWPDHTLRLFRKDVSKMETRAVHEKVNVNGPVGHIRAPFEHYTYRTISDYIGKMDFISSFLSMLFSPAVVFIKMYLVRQGFRDGIHGFVLAVLYSFYNFLKYAKVLERKGGF